MPFWLNERSRSLAVFVRTRERDDEHGKPSYNGHIVPLDGEAFAALAAKAKAGARRLRVDRVAVLSHDDDGFFGGRNLLLYTLDDWIRVERRSLLNGSEEASSTTATIRARFVPVRLLRYEADVVAPAHALAQRTLDWLRGVPEWTLDGIAVDLEPWVGRVRQVATALVRPPRIEPNQYGWAQLADVLPSALVEGLARSGFDTLRVIDSSWVGEVIGALNATGPDRSRSR